MIDTQTVLIVERQQEIGEILRTILSRRGVSIIEASNSEDGLALATQHHPDVVVLDIDQEETTQLSVTEQFQDALGRDESAMIVVSNQRQDEDSECNFIRKPFRYGPLVDIVQSLLEKHEPSKQAA